MTTVAQELMMGGSVRRIGNNVLASPRAFLLGAPIEGRERTAMIGAAEDLPYARATFVRRAGVRITIAARVSRPRCAPESSTPAKDAAREGGAVSSALDTEVVLTKTQVVDDPTDSGAGKVGPGALVGLRDRSLAAPGEMRIGNGRCCWLLGGGSLGGCLTRLRSFDEQLRQFRGATARLVWVPKRDVSRLGSL